MSGVCGDCQPRAFAAQTSVVALISLLALRAPERRTAVLVEAADGAAAARRPAFFALAVVDLERVLEVAKLARGLAMVAQRRAAGLDRLVQHRVDLFHQPPRVIGSLALLGRERCGQTPRRQMRAIERLADIDVAKSRHHALIEQRRLQAGLLVVAGLSQ